MFDFSFHDEIRINMTQNISIVIAAFPEEIARKLKIPAADYVFKVRDDGCILNEEQADAFHHMVYLLLFAANWTQCDIMRPVSFLTTRVQEPDTDELGKLNKS
jgi:hypothetical protein